MVTYGGMSKKPITVSTTSFIFKVIVRSFGKIKLASVSPRVVI